MKCALVIPSWKPDEIFSGKTAGSQINYWQPLGTLYVASAIREAGHEVKFIDGAFLSSAELIDEIDRLNLDFVGIYSTTFGWHKALKTATALRKSNPNVFMVAGGPFPIARQEKCLAECPELDAIVTGEGEETIVELLSKLEDQSSLKDVTGIVYRTPSGEIIKNQPRNLITDLDKLVFPARDLLESKKYYVPPPATYKRKPVAVIITSRGCNKKCIFCFQIDKTRASGIRFRSVENVMEEIELCLEQGYKEIKFIDDTLTADYDRAMTIAQEISKRKLKFTWFASGCVSQVDYALMKAFKEAGCWAILFGAESGVQKNLNAIHKGIKLEQTVEAVKIAKKAGLKVFTPFIFGIPGETFEEGLKTIEFACKLKPDVANFHALTAFPGTKLYDNLPKYGSISGDFSDFTYQGATFVSFTMTKAQILELRQIAFKKFYSRPQFLLHRVLALRNFDDIKVAYLGIKSLINLWFTKNIFKKNSSGC